MQFVCRMQGEEYIYDLHVGGAKKAWNNSQKRFLSGVKI